MTGAPALLLYGFSFFILVAYLPALVDPREFNKTILAILKDKNLVRAVFVPLGMIFAYLFLSVHWKFTDGWMMIFSILGWIAVVKSIVTAWWPEFYYRVTKIIFGSTTSTTLMGLFGIIVAILLAYITRFVM